MSNKLLHEKLIDELLDGKHSLSAREQAAANEIRVLKAELEGRAPKAPKKAAAKK